MNAKSFTTSDPGQILSILQEYGVVVLEGVVGGESLKELQEMEWEDLKNLTGGRIVKTDPRSWSNMQHLNPLHAMLIQNYGIAASPWLRRLRSMPQIAQVYARLWSQLENCKFEEKDMLVSFDGYSHHMPPETSGFGFYRGHGLFDGANWTENGRRPPEGFWLHCDQAPAQTRRATNVHGVECVQGFVNLYDTDKDDATLVVLPKSHLLYEEYFKKFPSSRPKDSWQRILRRDAYQFFVDRGCRPFRVPVKAGSLVLWDSRVQHQGVESIRGRKNPGRHRVVGYVCMMPRRFAVNQQVLEKKVQFFLEGRTCSHWPILNEDFSLIPRRGAPPFPITRPVPPKLEDLSDHERHLIGL